MPTESADRVLMITAIAGARECAASLEAQLGLAVELATTRREALSLLRRASYSVVVVDEAIAVANEAAADQLWKHAGVALPIQVNFAISGCPRLVREVRAALSRRQQEQALAMRAAAAHLDAAIRSSVTGLLLQAQLALGDPSVPPRVAERLKAVVELASDLRHHLESNRVQPPGLHSSRPA